MTYSCAYFAGGAETLEEAQEAKVELVCKKLGLREGERVLDVGCGWGSFVIHAATPPRRARGRDHALRASGRAGARTGPRGRPGRPRRDPRGRLPRGVRRAVRRDREHRDGRARGGGADRRLRSPAVRAAQARAAGCSTTGSPSSRTSTRRTRARSRSGSCSPTESRCRSHGSSRRSSAPSSRRRTSRGCSPTTRGRSRYWIERFDARWDDAVRLAGIERARIWRLYLRAARQGFETGWASVYQVLAHR